MAFKSFLMLLKAQFGGVIRHFFGPGGYGNGGYEFSLPEGKKSYMQSPSKVASSVFYPFAFIKPCGVHGDMILRDINKRICTLPKPKQGSSYCFLSHFSFFWEACWSNENSH